MSIPASGAFRRSGGVLAAITKEIQLINLKGVKRVTVTFDPFFENVKATREFLFHLSIPKVVKTNPNCVLKTNIVCDRTPPFITFTLIPPVQDKEKLKEIRFDSKNLTTLELLKLCNKYITKIAPQPEPVNIVATKSAKKSTRKK